MFGIRDAVIERRVVEVSNATGMMRLCHESEVLMLDDGTVISLCDLIEPGDPAAGFGGPERPALCGRIMFEPIHVHVWFILRTLASQRT
jgi:hypothetical protein